MSLMNTSGLRWKKWTSTVSGCQLFSGDRVKYFWLCDMVIGSVKLNGVHSEVRKICGGPSLLAILKIERAQYI